MQTTSALAAAHTAGAPNHDTSTLPAARGARLGFAAAACWLALGVESIVRPWQANYRDALWIVPWVLTALTFVAVHAAQRTRSGAVGSISFAFLMIATVLTLLGNVGLLLGSPTLAVFGFPWGALLWTAALVAFGAATWRARVLPRHAGIAIMLLEPASILTGLALSPIAPLHERGAYSGAVEKGLVLAVVAYALWSRRSQVGGHEGRSPSD
jgi:hypothetical protein